MTEHNNSNNGLKIGIGTILVIVIVAIIARFLLKVAVEVIFWIVIIGVVLAVVGWLLAKVRGRNR